MSAVQTVSQDRLGPAQIFLHGCRFGLNVFSMQLNEMTPGLEARLSPTDARWRKDLRALENGDYAEAR